MTPVGDVEIKYTTPEGEEHSALAKECAGCHKLITGREHTAPGTQKFWFCDECIKPWIEQYMAQAEAGVYFLKMPEGISPTDMKRTADYFEFLGKEHGIKFIVVAKSIEVTKASHREFDEAVQESLRRINTRKLVSLGEDVRERDPEIGDKCDVDIAGKLRRCRVSCRATDASGFTKSLRVEDLSDGTRYEMSIKDFRERTVRE